jgi:hypothetical protein
VIIAAAAQCETPTRSAIISQCAGATDSRGESKIVEEYFNSASGEEDWGSPV